MEAKMEVKSENLNKTVIYKQKFRREWKRDPLLRDWIREDKQNKNRAYCRFCKCYRVAKKNDLLIHAKTNKHLKAVRLFESQQEGDETTDAEDAPSAETSDVDVSPHSSKDNVADKRILKENKVKKERQRSSGVQKLSNGDISEDGDYMVKDNIHSDDDEEIFEMVHSATSGIPKKLQTERIKAETEYFRQKAIYFSKLAENSRIQRTMLILQSRKLHLEVQKLQSEF